MTTETPRKKPAAEVVGRFEDVMRRGKCDDGRDLYEFWDSEEDPSQRIYILAKSELEAWKSLRSELGTLEKLTKSKMHERTTQFTLELMEKQNGKAT